MERSQRYAGGGKDEGGGGIQNMGGEDGEREMGAKMRELMCNGICR